jgi:ubiquinone biosynthesis O-methyltransferase
MSASFCVTGKHRMAAANFDPSEIAKFEALADRWWDPTSEFKPLHDINPLRCNYIDERAPLAGKVVLDVGCGGGILSEAMAQRGAQVTGIDMGQAPLSVAKFTRTWKAASLSTTSKNPSSNWPPSSLRTTTS